MGFNGGLMGFNGIYPAWSTLFQKTMERSTIETMRKITISAIFHSYVNVYQRVFHGEFQSEMDGWSG